MMRKNGQLSIINILIWFVMIFISVILTPIMNDTITQAWICATNDTTQLLIAHAVVPIYWIGIIITLFLFVSPIRPRQFQ